MKRIIAILLCVVIGFCCTATAFATEIGFETDEDQAVYFDITGSGWEDPTSVYFFCWDLDDTTTEYTPYLGQKSLMTVDETSGLYVYDLTEHGFSIKPDGRYAVVFTARFDDGNGKRVYKETYPVSFDSSLLGEVAYTDQDQVYEDKWHERSYPTTYCFWRGVEADRYHNVPIGSDAAYHEQYPDAPDWIDWYDVYQLRMYVQSGALENDWRATGKTKADLFYEKGRSMGYTDEQVYTMALETGCDEEKNSVGTYILERPAPSVVDLNDPDVTPRHYTMAEITDDDIVCVAMTKRASFYQTYSEADFDPYGVVKVEIYRSPYYHDLVTLYLDHHSKQNVIDVIDRLYECGDVLEASPASYGYAPGYTLPSEDLLKAVNSYRKSIGYPDELNEEQVAVYTHCQVNDALAYVSIATPPWYDEPYAGEYDYTYPRYGIYTHVVQSIPDAAPSGEGGFLFIGGTLYRIDEALEKGVVDAKTLYEFAPEGGKSFFGFCLIGDADGDDELTVMDATRIQRCLAELCRLHQDVKHIADADGDGEMTVMDATRIQRVLADLDTIA